VSTIEGCKVGSGPEESVVGSGTKSVVDGVDVAITAGSGTAEVVTTIEAEVVSVGVLLLGVTGALDDSGDVVDELAEIEEEVEEVEVVEAVEAADAADGDEEVREVSQGREEIVGGTS